jgi:hypothetical protein
MNRSRPTNLTFAAYLAVNVSRVTWRARGRAPLAVGVLIAAVLALAPTASAHPLGNFSVNHLSTVRISDDEVRVRYILDQAEIPTVQERDLAPAEVLARKRDEVRRGLELTVDGRRVPLAAAGPPRLTFPPGAAGLRTTRLELSLRAAVDAPRRVELRDRTFPGRVGWKAVVSPTTSCRPRSIGAWRPSRCGRAPAR